MLLNVSVDTIEINIQLEYVNIGEIKEYFTEIKKVPNYYFAYQFNLNENIKLFLVPQAITENKERKGKLKIGASALIELAAGVDCNPLDYLPVEKASIAMLDIAFDFDRVIKPNEIELVQKQKIYENNQTTIKKKEYLKRVYYGPKYQGFDVGKRTSLFIRVYDKKKELQDKPNLLKSTYIDSYQSKEVWRMEFSVKSLFRHYVLEVPKDYWDVKNYSVVVEWIKTKVKAGNEKGNRILKKVNIEGIKINKQKKVVGNLEDGILKKMGIGKVLASQGPAVDKKQLKYELEKLIEKHNLKAGSVIPAIENTKTVENNGVRLCGFGSKLRLNKAVQIINLADSFLKNIPENWAEEIEKVKKFKIMAKEILQGTIYSDLYNDCEVANDIQRKTENLLNLGIN